MGTRAAGRPIEKSLKFQMKILKHKLNLLDTNELTKQMKLTKQNFFENANKPGRWLAYKVKKEKEKRLILKLKEEKNDYIGKYTLIPKEDMDVTQIQNCRPISLLNVDYKIFASILAERLKKFLIDFIHPDQNGFLPKRQMKNNLGTILDILEYYETHTEKPMALLFMDAQKAFDNANWQFMKQQMIQMEFGEKFMNAISSIHQKQSARILINGELSNPIVAPDAPTEAAPHGERSNTQRENQTSEQEDLYLSPCGQMSLPQPDLGIAEQIAIPHPDPLPIRPAAEPLSDQEGPEGKGTKSSTLGESGQTAPLPPDVVPPGHDIGDVGGGADLTNTKLRRSLHRVEQREALARPQGGKATQRMLNMSCVVSRPFMRETDYYRPGDLIVGGNLVLGRFSYALLTEFHTSPAMGLIGNDMTAVRNFQHIQALVFAITELNKDPFLLPNMTLGFRIYENRDLVKVVHSNNLHLLSTRGRMIPNYKCDKQGQLISVIQDSDSKSPSDIAALKDIYKIPEINTQHVAQYEGLVQLLLHFHWNWIGLLVQSNEHVEHFLQALTPLLQEKDICVAFTEMFSTVDAAYEQEVKTGYIP
ncbi:LINE-1 retrotransposable element ORF2 protein [Varanus komodoensis]|nr:LINE-1 retrotransposable element ORF2 protein [Varanus komodoensis]